MKTLRWVLPAIGSLMMGAMVQAEDNRDIQFASMNARMLNQRIDELESRLAGFEASEAAFFERVQHSGQSEDDGTRWCSPCAGLFGDAELLLLAWYDTDGDDRQNTVYTGSRYTLGHMNTMGRAVRGRYFEFASIDEVGGGELRIEHFDLEYAGRFALGRNWLGEISLGGRWAYLRTPQPRLWNDSYGPVLGVGVRSEIMDWISVYGGARQSYQFGPEVIENRDSVFGISELSLGLEVSRSLRHHEVFFRTGIEAQYYSSVRDDEEDYGLVGCTFALGIRH